jgi:hypothetical protein
MARGDAGALVPAPALAPAPTPAQVYLPAWRRTYDRLVKMLRQAYAQAEELSVEREHLITELQFLQSGLREREEISQARLQQVRTIRVPVRGLFLFAIGFGEGQLSAAADAR